MAESRRARWLEIEVRWGDTILRSLAFTDQPEVALDEVLGVPAGRSVLATRDLGGGYVLRLDPRQEVWVERPASPPIALADLEAAGAASPAGTALEYALAPHETVWIRQGPLDLRVWYQHAAPLAGRGRGITERLSTPWVNVLGMSLFVHLMLIAAFVATPGGGSALSESIARTRVPFREVLFQGAAPKPASDWIAKLRGEGQAAPQQRGAAGGPRRAERPGRMAAAGTGRDAQLRGREAFARLFGAGVTAGALDGEGNQRDLLRALGGVRGRTIADADGTGGMAARGPGPGGGGPPEGTLTIGALDRPGADPGSRPGKVGLTKSSQEIELSVGPVTLIGGTDKALLRRAIEGYRPQIRYCYERALAQTPGLYGKFLVEWTITADGRVNAPRVLESTMSPEVDRCLLEKIGRWRLPPPIGGGVVVVRYPFLFRSAG